MATPGSLRIIGHHLLEEPSDVVPAGVASIADVLAVVVAGFEGVVLDRDEIERDVVETGFACSHVGLRSHRDGQVELSERLPAQAGRETRAGRPIHARNHLAPRGRDLSGRSGRGCAADPVGTDARCEDDGTLNAAATETNPTGPATMFPPLATDLYLPTRQ